MAKLKETPRIRRSSSPTVEDLILDRLESIDNKLDSLAKDHIERVTKIETQIYPLFDNGQPGTLSRMQENIEDLQKVRWKQMGAVGALLFVYELGKHFVLKKVGLADFLLTTNWPPSILGK